MVAIVIVNVFKNVWARVYLNIYGSYYHFYNDNGLTLKAALMEFFLPTTKRKQNWRSWLGAGSGDLSIVKAAFIILIDIVLFFPRLAINVVKLVTEVLPDVIAHLLILAAAMATVNAYKAYDEREKSEDKKRQGLSTFAYGFLAVITFAFAGLFKLIYLLGCCVTSPFTTNIRASFVLKRDGIIKDETAFHASNFLQPAMSAILLGIVFFSIISLIPALGFFLPVTVAALTVIIGVYVAIKPVLSCFNRNPNGDNLFDFPWGEGWALDQIRYCDMDKIDKKIQKNVERELYPNFCFKSLFPVKTSNQLQQEKGILEKEIKRTLTYCITDEGRTPQADKATINSIPQ